MLPGTIFLLAGQGTQYYQMGKFLYNTDAEFRYWMDTQSALYGEWAGFSVVKRLYDPSRGKAYPFSEIALSHPAIFMIEYALGRSLMSQGRIPECLLGVSLGELIAFTLNESLSLETALHLVYQEATLIEQTCPRCKMYVLFEGVDFFYSHAWLYNCTEIVGVNNASQLVVAGSERWSGDLEKHFQAAGVRFMAVPISFGFHTALIEKAKGALQQVYTKVPILKEAMPMFSARSCAMVALSETNKVDVLWRRIREPFYLAKSIKLLAALFPSHEFLDVSPNSLFHTQAKLLDVKLENSIKFYLSPFQQ